MWCSSPSAAGRRYPGERGGGLGELFRKLAAPKESQIEEGHRIADHVPMMRSIPPEYVVSQVIGHQGQQRNLAHRLDRLALLVRGELRSASQLHVARLLTTGVIQILRDMLDPLRRLAQRNRHLLGPIRGGSRRSLQPREFGFELADAGVRLCPFVDEGNRRHDDETLVADLAEPLPQRENLGIDQLREVAETDFLAFVAGHPVDPAVDHNR
jgi:hypothetical protein